MPGLLLTTEAMAAELPEEEPKTPAGKDDMMFSAAAA